MMRDTPHPVACRRSKSTKMIIRTTITKSGTGADGEANLHAVRTAEQLLWYIAIANVFVYLLRYGIPTGHRLI